MLLAGLTAARCRNSTSLAARIAVVLALLAIAVAAPLGAAQRLIRRLAEEQGLAVANVTSIAQDHEGFLWIGTTGGLFRFDGQEMRRAGAAAPAVAVHWVESTPELGTLARQEGGTLVRAVGDTTQPVAGPDGAPLDRVASFALARDALFVLRDGAIEIHHAGTSQPVVFGPLALERPRHLRPLSRDSVALLTDRAVWELRRGQPPRRLGPARSAENVALEEDGTVLALEFSGTLWRLDGDATQELLPGGSGRGVSVTRRGEALWVALDHDLVALRPGRPPEALGLDQGIAAGGPLLVDHEGSLWLGTLAGLLQLPEPDTVIFDERDGLPSRHTRYVEVFGRRLWVTSWRGAAAVDVERHAVTAPVGIGWDSVNRVCRDDTGRGWVGTGQGLFVLDVDGRVLARHPGSTVVTACTPASSGGLWVATERGLLRTADDSLVPSVVGLPHAEERSHTAALVDGAGALWIGGAGFLCRTPEDRAMTAPEWRCEELPRGAVVRGLVELVPGEVWAAVAALGIVVDDGPGWMAARMTPPLASLTLHAFEPAVAGGAWLLGSGVLGRYEPAAVGAAGEPRELRLVEPLGAWQGVPTLGAQDLVEQPDGTLWLTTSMGLTRVPASARGRGGREGAGPPRVAIVGALVDGVHVAVDEALELPYGRNRVELRFAALSFRDPALVRYQVRVRAGESWADVEALPEFRWVDLAPGHYTAQVRASLDGETWTEPPAAFEFRVEPPWYRTSWAIALFVLAGAALLWSAYRVRVAYLLGLERQRGRIAMDLHDDLGSGLGSIGLLSGLAAKPDLPAANRLALAGEVARAAEELGMSLADILWSLGPRGGSLRELAARLAERGSRLFAEGGPTFRVELQDPMPDRRLSSLERRNLLLVGLEALHNARRHSGARGVALRLVLEGDDLRLEVRDDGQGIAAEARAVQDGIGLASMRERAAEIGAELGIRDAAGGGTVVALVLRLRGGRRRWRSTRDAADSRRGASHDRGSSKHTAGDPESPVATDAATPEPRRPQVGGGEGS